MHSVCILYIILCLICNPKFDLKSGVLLSSSLLPVHRLSQDVPLTEERLGALHELRLLEMRHNYELCLAEVRHAHENDKQKIVTEVRRLLTEDVRKIVGEVKRKQWVSVLKFPSGFPTVS